jgi:chlorobactene glucosyltransferase
MILLYDVLSGIMISICIVWLYFLLYTVMSLRRSPCLRQFATEGGSNIRRVNTTKYDLPMVSIIIPARNEENYVDECLNSLLKQTYQNFEIVVVDDGSSDRTAEIFQYYGKKDARIKIVSIDEKRNKPDGWTGKTWACYQGYIHSTGNILLFTDADTTHSYCTLSLSLLFYLSNELNALTLIPRLRAEDFWTRLTLPILWTLSYARYSPLKANNPNTRVGGYFFGSFIMIGRDAYEIIGTHERVREEIVEDVELGRIVKDRGLRSRVVHGEHHITAIWARNLGALWDGLRRLMIPMYLKEKAKAVMITFATSLMLLMPLIVSLFLILWYSVDPSSTTFNNEKEFPWHLVLITSSIVSIVMLILTIIIQSKAVIFQSLLYTLGFPIAGSILSAAFISAIFDSRKKNAIRWHERNYTYSPRK